MANDTEIKTGIEAGLKAFQSGAFAKNAVRLFDAALGYSSEKTIALESSTPEGLLGEIGRDSFFNRERAHDAEWKSVDLLFQLTDEEIRGYRQTALGFDSSRADIKSQQHIESYIFLAVELKKDSYTRTTLADITREINRLFPMPALILFQHGMTLTLSVINRRLHKRDESKDVLEKVTFVKDIDFTNPKRSQIEILFDLSFAELNRKHTVSNFVELHKAWSETLDTKELNRRFFKELSNWYFWAVREVEFPNGEGIAAETHTAVSVIRLITRLMFVWFLKEKGLVGDEIFSERKLKSIIKFEDESAFYKAVLQNLFFATLNTDSQETPRRFRGKKSANGRYDQHHGVHNVFRYADEFVNAEQALKTYFEGVPFLNGGLFECLDKPEAKIYVDGFSERKDNRLRVPDKLFFGDERAVDLNPIYDTKNKNYKVRGLIKILDNYKFTIAENTPLEEEIALDPELLGKVFENLLANYNPETKTTARKQTGSFYTPREIVGYMVDESLLAYLKTKLHTEVNGFLALVDIQATLGGNDWRNGQLKLEEPLRSNRWLDRNEAELETALRELFAYDDKPHGFNEIETEILLRAIDECKILDPACGSGAFPMGILQRLVFLLGKLDRDNAKWRELQRLKAVAETDEAFKIGDVKERERRLLEINEVFENNQSDYGRKLFLIENCIYGVDIQPVAIQISKLRFFISLIIDQTIDDARPNRGVRPLPNLETKLVAANTLIGLDGAGGLKPEGVTDLEAELKETRHAIFRARTPQTKKKYRDKDANLRAQIAELMKQGGINSTSADKIAAWQPYNQDAHADWFDAEWMFGITDGFDIVIANPPYIDSETMVNIGLREVRDFITANYKTTKGNWDIYIAFTEKSFNLLNEEGGLIFITPDKWISKPFGEELRKSYLKNISSILVAGRGVFESANVDSIVTLFSKFHTQDLRISSTKKDGISAVTSVSKSIIKPPYALDFLFSSYLSLLLKMENQSKTFSDFLVCESACATSDAYKLKPLITDYENATPSKDVYFKMINTGTVGKYVPKWGRKQMTYLKDKYSYPVVNREDFRSEFRNSYYEKSIKPKVIIKGLTLLDACLDEIGEVIPGKSTLIVTDSNISKLKTASAFINSRLYFFYISEKYSSSSYNEGVTFSKDMINSVPLPSLDKVAKPLEKLVDEILAAKRLDAAVDTRALEREIDKLVYRLYELTDDEIKIVEGQV